MSSRPRMPRAERREAILDAASGLFDERPYDAVSMSDIVRVSGVSRPVVYDHFRTKEEVVIALIRRQHESVVEELAAAGAAPGGVQSESDYRRLLDVVFDHFERDPAGWRLLCNEPSPNPLIAAAQRETRDEVLGLTTAALNLPPRSEILAEGLRNAVNGLFAWQREHRRIGRAQLIDAAVALTWRGLAP
jgi:AcrR family transcriptional regulator